MISPSEIDRVTRLMKNDIHPEYVETAVTCGCGNTFTTRSTKEKISVEICSSCHPFYTGKQKFVDAAGRIERFKKKWGGSSTQKQKEAVKVTKKDEPKSAPSRPGTIAAQLPAAEKPAAPKAEAAPEAAKKPESEGKS